MRTIRDTLRDVAKIPLIALAGIQLWVDPPRRWKLRVNKDYDFRSQEQADELAKLFAGKTNTNYVLPVSLASDPNVKVIRLEYWRKSWVPFIVKIDLEKKRLIDSAWVLGKGHRGSGGIGVGLLSLPVILPLAPILFLINLGYYTMERKRGISRHALAFLRALEGQLDKETEELLVEVFKNEWVLGQYMKRLVTLEQAKEFLRLCKLNEEYVSANIDICKTEGRAFHWFDDQGENVANGNFYGQRDHYVWVLGSQFEDEQADALVECYESKELIDYSERVK